MITSTDLPTYLGSIGNSLLNLLLINTNNSIFFGLPKVTKESNEDLIPLPVYKTSSIITTFLFSIIKSILVNWGFKTFFFLLKSSLKKVESNSPYFIFSLWANIFESFSKIFLAKKTPLGCSPIRTVLEKSSWNSINW